MKEFIETIVKAIVDHPDQVVITEERGPDGIVLRLQVATEDRGKVIGRQGRVVQAMRTLLRSLAARAGTRANLEIV